MKTYTAEVWARDGELLARLEGLSLAAAREVARHALEGTGLVTGEDHDYAEAYGPDATTDARSLAVLAKLARKRREDADIEAEIARMDAIAETPWHPSDRK